MDPNQATSLCFICFLGGHPLSNSVKTSLSSIVGFVTEIVRNLRAVTTDNNVACRVAGEDMTPEFKDID